MLTILLTAYIIMLIIPLLCVAYKRYHDHYAKRRTQYREHIDHLVNELFPPATHASDAQEATVQEATVQEATVQEATVQEATVQYQETKRKMIADIRKYFNRREIKTLPPHVDIPDPPDESTLYLQ